ncbi:MAG: hypothetical protein VX589_09495, partial [Myxococcota bacterium]|nr:hypothetical protein [Myxococcota bacterium]
GHRLNAEPSDEALKGRPAPQSRRPKPRGRKSSGPTGRPRVAKTTDDNGEAAVSTARPRAIDRPPAHGKASTVDGKKGRSKTTGPQSSKRAAESADSTRLLDAPKLDGPEPSAGFTTKEIDKPAGPAELPRPVIVDAASKEHVTQPHMVPAPSVVVDKSAYTKPDGDDDELADSVKTEVHNLTE